MTRPNTEIDGVGCLLLLIVYLFTWVSFEFYHWMRQEEFPSLSWFVFVAGSIAAMVIGSMFLKAAVKK